MSPFEGLTAGFSSDASGDFASLMAARCEGTRIQVLDRGTRTVGVPGSYLGTGYGLKI